MDQMTEAAPRVPPRRARNALRAWLKRKPKRMSIVDFAKMVGVTPGYVSQLISKEPPWPSRDVARRIALVTGGEVTPNDLAGWYPPGEEPGDEGQEAA